MAKRKGETLDDFLRRLTGQPHDGPMTQEEAVAYLLEIHDLTTYLEIRGRASVDDPSETEDIRWLEYRAAREKVGEALGRVLQADLQEEPNPENLRLAFVQMVNIVSWALEEEDYTTAGRAVIALVELAPNVLKLEDSETEEGES